MRRAMTDEMRAFEQWRKEVNLCPENDEISIRCASLAWQAAYQRGVEEGLKEAATMLELGTFPESFRKTRLYTEFERGGDSATTAPPTPECAHMFKPNEQTCYLCGWEQPGAKGAAPESGTRPEWHGDQIPPEPRMECPNCNGWGLVPAPPAKAEGPAHEVGCMYPQTDCICSALNPATSQAGSAEDPLKVEDLNGWRVFVFKHPIADQKWETRELAERYVDVVLRPRLEAYASSRLAAQRSAEELKADTIMGAYCNGKAQDAFKFDWSGWQRIADLCNQRLAAKDAEIARTKEELAGTRMTLRQAERERDRMREGEGVTLFY